MNIWITATLEDGVEVYNFDERMEYLRTLSKVAVRQLSVKRTPEMIDGLYRYRVQYLPQRWLATEYCIYQIHRRSSRSAISEEQDLNG